MKNIKIVVFGDPMGKQRPKARNAGNFIQIYTPKETVNYESKVVNAYKQNHADMVFDHHDEVWATIVAYFKIPKSCYRYHKKTDTTDLTKEGEDMKNGNLNPMKKPDNDNIAKLCLDALNGIAYPDDSQITGLLVLKRYSEQPRVEITLEGVDKCKNG